MSAANVCPQCGTEYSANARFCEVDGTALRSASAGADLEGSIIAERYLVLEKLGEGGMGQVYLAEHVKMGRRSALKILRPGLIKDVDAISRFNREAANASRISHPNVAAVYDFGETPEGLIYLAMELVDGPTLTKLIAQQGALPPKRAAEIARQTAEALAVAHDMGIVHRDLKPDNIMIARTRDGGDLVKVVDFGIAKTAGAGSAAQQVTKTGLIVGTPEYMSPEQLSADSLNGQSDIYALGLVTFNMLTGQLPFPSDSAQESMIMRLTEKPKPLAEMKPNVVWPAEVQAVMDKALERSLALRYRTSSEFGRDLVNAVDRMPDSIAMEMGTQVVGEVPVTRVSPAGPVTDRVGFRDTAPRSRRFVPAVAGAIVLIATAAFATPMLLRKQPAAPAAAAADTAAPRPGRNPAQPTQVESFSRVASKGTAADAGDVEASLSKLEKDADDSTLARGVADQITNLYDKLTTDDERARADYIRFRAYLTRNDRERACRSITAAEEIAKSQTARQKYAERAEGCR